MRPRKVLTPEQRQRRREIEERAAWRSSYRGTCDFCGTDGPVCFTQRVPESRIRADLPEDEKARVRRPIHYACLKCTGRRGACLPDEFRELIARRTGLPVELVVFHYEGGPLAGLWSAERYRTGNLYIKVADRRPQAGTDA